MKTALFQTPKPLQGIDVSTDQGSIDWAAAHNSGIGFAYIKASEGLNTGAPSRQAYYDANWPRIHAAGILRGAYHYFRANVDSQAQADAFLKATQECAGTDLPPMVDIEEANGVARTTTILRAHRVLERIQDVTAWTPVIYTYASFWNECLDTSFSAYPLWIAAYGADRPTAPITPSGKPALPTGFTEAPLWQYDDHGQVRGVLGNVADLDMWQGVRGHAYQGTQAEMRAWASGLKAPAK